MDGPCGRRFAWLLTLLLGGTSGCASHAINRDIAHIAMSDMPRELNKVTHPTYRVEPPDILLVEAVNNIRPANAPLQAGDELTVRLQNHLPLQIDADPELQQLEYQFELEREISLKIINGPYRIGADGTVDFGPVYGKVPVAGLSLPDAQAAIERHMYDVGVLNPKLTVDLPNVAGKQPITGEHLVRPDGSVALGIYGQVHVAGMTLDEVKYAVEQHLAQHVHQPEVSVDVLAYNSKVFYVIMDGGGYGAQVIKLPCTGNETVLDAFAQLQGLPQFSSKKIWIARPAPSETGAAQILPVHWNAIAAEGITTTNYQLLPGDRIYVQADHLIATDNFLAKLISPIERVLGVTLLGSSAAQSIDFYEQQGTQGGGP